MGKIPASQNRFANSTLLRRGRAWRRPLGKPLASALYASPLDAALQHGRREHDGLLRRYNLRWRYSLRSCLHLAPLEIVPQRSREAGAPHVVLTGHCDCSMPYRPRLAIEARAAIHKSKPQACTDAIHPAAKRRVAPGVLICKSCMTSLETYPSLQTPSDNFLQSSLASDRPR